MRSEPIHPAELGGTLFVPATHRHLQTVLEGAKFPKLRSAVIDLEDGIDAPSRPEALQRIASLLPAIRPATLLRFIRPDTPQTLQELLQMKGIANVDGFVLPKFGLDNAEAWLSPLQNDAFALMPSIEGPELFSQPQLHLLAERLLPWQQRIPTIRFGLEDLLRQLGIARDCRTPLYGLAAPALAIASVLAAFKPRGFNVSGGVYGCYEDAEGFRSELEEELRQGLLGKTIIHPSQIDIVEEAYRVGTDEQSRADALLRTSSNVTALHGMMLEKPTQLPWAETVHKRAALYGVKA
jgi:citrate lyase beta subunit